VVDFSWFLSLFAGREKYWTPGPHDFAVRFTRISLMRHPRPSPPAPNVRNDRETPLVEGHRTAAFMDFIWAKREGKYF